MKFTAPKGKRLCGIYCIQNLLDGKVYYGQSDNVRRRFRDHLAFLLKGTHDNPRLQNAFNKHGSNAFEMRVVELVSQEKLNEVEQRYLDDNTGKEHCYNIMRSVEQTFRGQKHSLEALNKMSKTWFGKGKSHMNYGKRLSEEIRQKISEAHKGKTVSAETRKKLSELNSGEKHPLFGKKGSAHPAFGHQWDDARRAKMSLAIKEQNVSVIQNSKDGGTLIAEFDSLKSAEEVTGIKYQSISRCCRGVRPSAGGFKWKYKEM